MNEDRIEKLGKFLEQGLEIAAELFDKGDMGNCPYSTSPGKLSVYCWNNQGCPRFSQELRWCRVNKKIGQLEREILDLQSVNL